MDHDGRATMTACLRGSGHLRRDHAARRLDFPGRLAPDAGGPGAWNVDSWTTAPGQPYRLNTLFDRISGAVITATGRFDDSTACAELGTTLRPFERLGCPIIIDLCHAVLGVRAARALIEIGSRHDARPAEQPFAIIHAEPGTRRRIERAGGHRFVRPPCGHCRPTAG